MGSLSMKADEVSRDVIGVAIASRFDEARTGPQLSVACTRRRIDLGPYSVSGLARGL